MQYHAHIHIHVQYEISHMCCMVTIELSPMTQVGFWTNTVIQHLRPTIYVYGGGFLKVKQAKVELNSRTLKVGLFLCIFWPLTGDIKWN